MSNVQEMKILHFSIIAFSFLIILSSSQSVFGQQQNTTDGYIHYGPSRQSIPSYLVSPQHNATLEEQFGNTVMTKLVHGDSMLILNQTSQKLTYKMGENITIIAELVNIGNKTVEVAYCEPWVALEIKNQTGNEVWPNSQWVCIPEFYGTKILQPGEHISIQPWGVTFAPYSFLQPKLSVPGNYTVMSVAVLTFDMNPKNIRSVEPLWSKPLQITILPEKVPEFPFTVAILLVGMVSAIVFYRTKFGK